MNDLIVGPDEGGERKYFFMMPNLCDEELDPYEFRLFGHYQRVCGRDNRLCKEDTRTTAEKCKMSHPQLIKVRRTLRDKGFIDVGEVTIDGLRRVVVRLPQDLWDRNVLHFATQKKPARQASFEDTIQWQAINEPIAEIIPKTQKEEFTKQPGHCMTSQKRKPLTETTGHDVYQAGHDVYQAGHDVYQAGHDVSQGGHDVSHINNYIKNYIQEPIANNQSKNHHHHHHQDEPNSPSQLHDDDDGLLSEQPTANCNLETANSQQPTTNGQQPAQPDHHDSQPIQAAALPPSSAAPPSLPGVTLTNSDGEEFAFDAEQLKPLLLHIMERMKWLGAETYLNRVSKEQYPCVVVWLWIWYRMYPMCQDNWHFTEIRRCQYDPFVGIKNPVGKIIKQVALGNMPDIADRLVDDLISELQQEPQEEPQPCANP